jgi:DNA-directed RNA polymerase alpha subunit
MTHRSYAYYGDDISDGWGQDDQGDLYQKIKHMSAEMRMQCLMAAMARQVRELRGDLLRLAVENYRESEAPSKDVMADAKLQTLRVFQGDTPISEIDCSRLSVRARRTLIKAGITMLSQITEKRLMEIRNCGKTTTDEIMKWARRNLSQNLTKQAQVE